ncbi:hypothetical protein NI392_09155 [Vibrio alginolyticus]|uniref:hypothetical protein n=1 Tax=Vibrio alginolyticus TaxID=663 RepID=UPI0028F41A18|nr:hypothetical protein [Vibrio alginolyticus]WMN48319.1 hypothetical protein NI392_09155 [Vibrio alginolyticus]
MSLYVVTNHLRKAEKAAKAWNDLGFESTIRTLGQNCYIATSKAYREHDLNIYNYNGIATVAIGTFFTRESFDKNEIAAELYGDVLTESDLDKLYGHFTIIQVHNDKIHVMNDKVGMMNVYFSEESSSYCFGNDLIVVTVNGDSTELSTLGVMQFCLNESTQSGNTIFNGVKRLKLGNGLYIKRGTISEVKFHHYMEEVFDFPAYLDSVAEYFNLIGNYKKKIAVELSAGFDTRLIASASSGRFPFIGISNQNKFDNGVDEKIAKEIALKLNVGFNLVKRPNESENNKNELLHLLSVGRDINRSRDWISICKGKYAFSNLIIGGYGGESLRFKYNKYGSLKSFVSNFYKSKLIRNRSERHLYNKQCSEDLNKSVLVKLGGESYSISNLIYTLDRMRIWGGEGTAAMYHFGDRLHPFMDWKLIGPILSLNLNTNEGEKLQAKIINSHCSSLMNIPINPKSVDVDGTKSNIFKRAISSIYICKSISSRIQNKIRESFPCNFGHLKYIEDTKKYKIPIFRTASYDSRLKTVDAALGRVLELKKLD